MVYVCVELRVVMCSSWCTFKIIITLPRFIQSRNLRMSLKNHWICKVEAFLWINFDFYNLHILTFINFFFGFDMSLSDSNDKQHDLKRFFCQIFDHSSSLLLFADPGRLPVLYVLVIEINVSNSLAHEMLFNVARRK